LPFGTIVLVTNLENTRQVRVRINDRGPYAKGRVLDLSYAAAQELQMVENGTSRIALKVTHAKDEAAAAVNFTSKKSAVPVISLHAQLHHAKPEFLPSDQSGYASYNAHQAQSHRTTLVDVWQRRARRHTGQLELERFV